MKNDIFDEKLYEIDKINNFLCFLRSDFKIDLNKTLKQIILEALNYNEDFAISKDLESNTLRNKTSNSKFRTINQSSRKTKTEK